MADLPPLPSPNLSQQRSESCTGVCVVLTLISLLVGVPYWLALARGPLFTTMDGSDVGMCLLFAEASVAILCLLGLLFGDPGTLKRSPQACLPPPAAVAERLRRKQALAGLENAYENGQVFCMRCCIWRPESASFRDTTHHCSICQRCVVDFDHHCGVFGRCIAGRGWRGNMGYFKCILLCAFAGFMTCVGTVLTSSASQVNNGTNFRY
jgi:hypothetical protein